MIFELSTIAYDAYIGPTGKLVTQPKCWTWALVQADGHIVARSDDFYADEKEARSAVAEAKKSMKGAWRCKVQVAE